MRCNSIKRPLNILAILCIILLLSACAATATQQEGSVEDRANARWAALFDNDIEGAYKFLSPGYRSSVSLSQYQRMLLTRQVRWTSAKYVSSKCEEATCDVKILVGFTVSGALPGVKSFNGTDYVDESWVKVNGNWYMVPEL